MSKPRRNMALLPLDDTIFASTQRKPVPHAFVLDAIAPLSPETRPMLGCLAVYVQGKIMLILRDKRDQTVDNGVWLATTKEHHQSLRRGFPNMRSTQGVVEEGNGLAGPSGRSAGFRGGGAARLRAHPGRGSSNRKGAGGAAGLGNEGQKVAKPSKRAKAPKKGAKARARS